MEIENKSSILKYLKINSVDQSECFFACENDPATSINGAFITVRDNELGVSLESKPPTLNGHIIFYSYVYIFKFRTHLNPTDKEKYFTLSVPEKIVTTDRRRYPRYHIPADESKITVELKKKDTNFTGESFLMNISADGLAFRKTDRFDNLNMGEKLDISFKIDGIQINAELEIVYIRKYNFGCRMINLPATVKNELSLFINNEISRISDNYLDWLENTHNSTENQIN